MKKNLSGLDELVKSIVHVPKTMIEAQALAKKQHMSVKTFMKNIRLIAYRDCLKEYKLQIDLELQRVRQLIKQGK